MAQARDISGWNIYIYEKRKDAPSFQEVVGLNALFTG